MPQKKKKASVPPGNWMGPPNSSGVRASESFFERSPTQRNNKRGASAPTHIGMLPNNVIMEINKYAGGSPYLHWAHGKILSRLISEARTIRSLKGLQLLPHRRNRPRVAYDPKYKTVLKGPAGQLAADGANVNSLLLSMYNLTYKPSVENMKRARLINRTPRSPRNSPTHNEINAENRLSSLRQHAAKAGRTSMKKVQNNTVLFYSVHHPNMKIGPHTLHNLFIKDNFL